MPPWVAVGSEEEDASLFLGAGGGGNSKTTPCRRKWTCGALVDVWQAVETVCAALCPVWVSLWSPQSNLPTNGLPAHTDDPSPHASFCHAHAFYGRIKTSTPLSCHGSRRRAL